MTYKAATEFIGKVILPLNNLLEGRRRVFLGRMCERDDDTNVRNNKNNRKIVVTRQLELFLLNVFS